MSAESELTQKREELKRQLAAGEYKTLIDVMLDGTGRFIQKLSRNLVLPPFWYSALVLALLIWSISLLLSLLLDEFHSIRRKFITIEILIVALLVPIWIGFKIYTDSFFSNVHNHLLDAIESEADLVNFQHWLAAVGNLKKPLVLGLVVGVWQGITNSARLGGFIGFGPMTFLVISMLASVGIGLYYVFLFTAWPVRLSRYHFNLSGLQDFPWKPPYIGVSEKHLNAQMPNLKKIRTLLTEGFTAEELRRFCYDKPDFRPVYDKLAQDSGKATIIDLLIEYSEQKLLIDILLDLAKQHNPARYEKHQPYHDVITIATTSSSTHGKSQRALYTSDPSSSEIIHRLSDLLSNFVYLCAVIVALAIFFGVYAGQWFNIIRLILLWIPLILLFILNQYALSRIIINAKWKTLNNIQAKIGQLQTQEEIPAKDTLAHIRELMDYHDHIRNTRNTAFDFRAGLNFLNSLLIPLLAFVLANLDKMLSLFNW